MIDGHIHMMKPLEGMGAGSLLARALMDAGLRGGVVLSLPPRCFSEDPAISSEERLEQLIQLTEEGSRIFAEGEPGLIPFFWIDPLDPLAAAQVNQAVSAGVKGFKVICVDQDPGFGPSLSVYQRIADHGRPILFHSGILWNSKNSSNFCRPANFECLLSVENLRFALAHIGWPWCDECLAVFGKFQQTKSMGFSQEMYVDLTPGTPEIYRREALLKLHTIGYEVEDRIFFGSDCHAHCYDGAWTRSWQEIDRAVYEELKLRPEIIEKIEEGNLTKFIGLTL